MVCVETCEWKAGSIDFMPLACTDPIRSIYSLVDFSKQTIYGNVVRALNVCVCVIRCIIEHCC